MYLYLVPILLLVLSLISKNNRISHRPSLINNTINTQHYRLFKVATIFLVIFSGLRDPFVYPDNISYYYGFNDLRYLEDDTINQGYIWINVIFKSIWPNFYFFSFVVSTIITISYCNFIRKYSPFVWTSLILFVLINYYPSFFLLRQYLAMPFVFGAMHYTIERKPIKFLLCVLGAYSMHTTSLVIAPMYVLYMVRNNRKSILFISSFTIICSLCLVMIGGFLSSYFPMYEHYLGIEIEESSWSRAVMKVYILGVFVYACRKQVFENGINKIVFLSMIMNVIICVGAMNVFGVFRLRDYFSIGDIIGIPIIWKYSNSYKGYIRVLIKFMIVVYLLLLIISFVNFVTGENMNSFYQFFWLGKPHEWSK